MRLLVPIILIIAAIGLFALYTNPTYQASKALAVKAAAYDNALTKSQELRTERDKLLSKRNTFSPDDIQKVEEILPDNVDNIRLIIDINNIAARHGLSLSNVQIGSVGSGAAASAAAALSAGAGAGPVGSVDIGFSVTTTYETMLAFIQDVEHSLRLIDIEKLSFSSPNEGGSTSYSLGIRTYWLH
jgi:Tfp pilus assembly protein PilO